MGFTVINPSSDGATVTWGFAPCCSHRGMGMPSASLGNKLQHCFKVHHVCEHEAKSAGKYRAVFPHQVSRHVGEDIVFPGRNVRSSQGLNLGFRCQGTLGGVLQRMQFGLGSNKMHPGM